MLFGLRVDDAETALELAVFTKRGSRIAVVVPEELLLLICCILFLRAVNMSKFPLPLLDSLPERTDAEFEGEDGGVSFFLFSFHNFHKSLSSSAFRCVT